MKPHLKSQSDFRNAPESLDISNDWFTNNIPYWLYTLTNTIFYLKNKYSRNWKLGGSVKLFYSSLTT